MSNQHPHQLKQILNTPVFLPQIAIPKCQTIRWPFHLRQAIQRRIAEEGLKKHYGDNPLVIRHIKEFIALLFVPIECIKPLFAELYNRV